MRSPVVTIDKHAPRLCGRRRDKSVRRYAGYARRETVGPLAHFEADAALGAFAQDSEINFAAGGDHGRAQAPRHCLLVTRSPKSLVLLPGEVGAAYLRIRGGVTADHLTSLATTLAQVAETHESFVDDRGMMRMEARPEGFEVPAQGELVLEPGGRHVMLHGLAVPDDAREIKLTLRFSQAGERTVQAKIVRPGAAP